MADGGGGGVGGGEAVAMELEDAVKLLVEHLVQPVLPRSGLLREAAPTPEKQEIVARQVHATVLLYNYYHRKQFPQLAFADPKRFTVSASLAAGDGLLVYLNHGGGDAEAEPSVTDKAVVDACGIAEALHALDATAESPEMTSWPISKVAVLLVDRTGKKCLIEHGSVTKGVWSILEKDIAAASGKLGSVDLSAPGASNDSSEPFLLQQTAYSVVESKTGIKQTSLRFLQEHLVYSLSKKETNAKLFVLQYEETVNSNLKEMPIEDLISRMSGPMFTSDPFSETTSVVEYYHILPYKEVLLNLLDRESSLESPESKPKEQHFLKGKSSLHSEIDECLKGQEGKIKSNIKNTTTNAADTKRHRAVKEVGNKGTNSCSTSKNRKNSNLNSKRKSETLRLSPNKENGSLSIPDIETLKFESNSVNAEVSRAKSGGLVDMETSGQMDSSGFDSLQTSVRMDKKETGKHTAPEVDPIVKNHSSENQIVKITEMSSSIAGNTSDQICALLQWLQKMRDDILREQCMLGDRSAQFDMDIQTILTDGKMTPRVMSILKEYGEDSANAIEVASSTSSSEGSNTLNMKRKRLTEAVLSRNKCQELDEICRENNWILPRYAVLPSLVHGLYQATVYLICPDLEMFAEGDMKNTPREARESAATDMLSKLHQKAKEKRAELGSSTPDAVLLDKIPEK